MTDDARDEQLGDALAVPPLDDVTRRRLVRNAIDALGSPETDADDEAAASREPRSWAPLAAAAVVILLVVVGFVALGRGGDDDASDTAARKADRVPTAETPTAQAPAADASSGAAASLVPGILDLGDLGNLSSAARRERTRTALTTGTLTDSEAATELSSEQLLREVADSACAAPLRADGTTVVGVGSATVDGDRAVVVVTETAGARAAFVLVPEPCALSPL